MPEKSQWCSEDWYWTWNRMVVVASTASSHGPNCTVAGIHELTGVSRRSIGEILRRAEEHHLIHHRVEPHNKIVWLIDQKGRELLWMDLAKRHFSPGDWAYHYKLDAAGYTLRLWKCAEAFRLAGLTRHQVYRRLRRFSLVGVEKIVAGSRTAVNPGGYIMDKTMTNSERTSKEFWKWREGRMD